MKVKWFFCFFFKKHWESLHKLWSFIIRVISIFYLILGYNTTMFYSFVLPHIFLSTLYYSLYTSNNLPYQYYLLSIQKWCQSSYQIHGLWPQNNHHLSYQLLCSCIYTHFWTPIRWNEAILGQLRWYTGLLEPWIHQTPLLYVPTIRYFPRWCLSNCNWPISKP